MSSIIEGRCMATGIDCNVVAHAVLFCLLAVLAVAMAWRLKQRAAKTKEVQEGVRKVCREVSPDRLAYTADALVRVCRLSPK